MTEERSAIYRNLARFEYKFGNTNPVTIHFDCNHVNRPMTDQNSGNSTALERENQQLRRAVEELSVLNELSIAISSSRGTDEVIQTIIRRSIKAISAEQGVITMVGDDVSDPTKTLVRTMASSGDREAYSPDQNLLGWMYIK